MVTKWLQAAVAHVKQVGRFVFGRLAPVSTFGSSATALIRYVCVTPSLKLFTEARCARRASCGPHLLAWSEPLS